MREKHDEYREQDEWVCPKCGCRWGIDERSPEECKSTRGKRNVPAKQKINIKYARRTS